MYTQHPTRPGTPALRITTYAEPPAASYRAIVASLALRVAGVATLDELPAVLPALRAALGDALVVVPTERVVLHGALLRLARCLEDATAGRPPRPDRLAIAFAGVVRAIDGEPRDPRPTVVQPLERIVGVIGVASGRLIAAKA